jgi:acetyl esterase/lipase
VLSAADTWVSTHGDLSRVFLVGDSAGGNIFHHLAMHPDVKAGAGGVKGIVLIHPWFWGKEPIGGKQEHRRPRTTSKRVEAESGGRGRMTHLWEFSCAPRRGRRRGRPPDEPDGARRAGAREPGVREGDGVRGDHLRWRGKAYAGSVALANTTRKGGEQPTAAAVAPAELLDDDTAVAAACVKVKDAGGQPAAVEVLESEGVGHVTSSSCWIPRNGESFRIAVFVRAK